MSEKESIERIRKALDIIKGQHGSTEKEEKTRKELVEDLELSLECITKSLTYRWHAPFERPMHDNDTVLVAIWPKDDDMMWYGVMMWKSKEQDLDTLDTIPPEGELMGWKYFDFFEED